jgi:hypothetical protein
MTEETTSQTAAAEPDTAGEPVTSEAPPAAIPPDVITPPPPSELDLAKSRLAELEQKENHLPDVRHEDEGGRVISADQVVEARKKLEAAKAVADLATKDYARAIDRYFAENPSFIFSARSRCKCGAPIAYQEGAALDGAWKCWSVMEAERKNETLDGVHDEFPFAFYSVISESSPRADGASTRPPHLPKWQPHPWHDAVFKKKE